MASLDTIFDLLSEERRRYVLYHLEEQDEPVSVRELVELVAEHETDSSMEVIPDEKFERVDISLQHSDLPKLDEVEFIEYVPEEGVVRITGTPPKFDAIITVARIIERPGN